MAGAFNKSDIEILLSTMNRESLDFLLPMFPFAHFSDFTILIINQTTAANLLTSQYPSVRVMNVFERGLSKSRNLAIANASKKIGLIADDDLVYIEGFDERIATGFNRFADAAVVKFNTVSFEGVPFRKYPTVPTAVLSDLQRLNSGSIEIALDTAIVKQSGICLNTHFGLGSTFPLGEEPIFLNELYHAGYPVCHEPEVIVSHKSFKDSDRISLAENYRIRGAYLSQIFGKKFGLWLGIQLMYNLKSGEVKPWQVVACIKNALTGKKQLKHLQHENIS